MVRYSLYVALFFAGILACQQSPKEKKCFSPDDCKSSSKRCIAGTCQVFSGTTCGDFIVEGDEACDDGNQSNNDACLNTCLAATCGDGYLNHGVEECDKGNANTDSVGDACRTNCTLPYCGDGTKDSGESCDDGNGSNEDACLNSCEEATCGDEYVQADVEECDDGNESNEDACLNSCEEATCGDEYVQAGAEECDDGNEVNTDACLNTCEEASCGDGYINAAANETCDDGVAGTPTDSEDCDADCTAPACGDGYTNTLVSEECDAGVNGTPSDSADCDIDCTTQTCGDGYKNTVAEACDDGYTDPCGSCNTDCSDMGDGATCGDGFICEENETCDDGSLFNYDAWAPTTHCGTSCTFAPSCGDGILQDAEDCEENDASACSSNQTCIECRCTCDANLGFIGGSTSIFLTSGTLHADTAYMGDAAATTLHVFDRLDNGDFLYSGERATQGLVKAIKVHGNYIYLAEANGFEVLERSGTQNAYLSSIHSEDISIDAISMEKDDDDNVLSVIILDISQNNIHRLDVSNPLSPTEKDTITYTGGEIPYGILAEEGKLFVLTNNAFYAYALESAPTLSIGAELGTIHNGETLDPIGPVPLQRYNANWLLAPIKNHGLRIYDTSDTSDLCFTHPWADAGTDMYDSVLYGDYLYTTHSMNELKIFTINTSPGLSDCSSTPLSLTPVAFNPPAVNVSASLLGVIGDQLYMGVFNTVLNFDLTLPLAPSSRQVLVENADNLVVKLALHGKHLLATTMGSKILVFDISDPFAPEFMAEIENGLIGQADNFVFYQHYALSDRLNYIIDLSNPSAPVLTEITIPFAEWTAQGILIGHHFFKPYASLDGIFVRNIANVNAITSTTISLSGTAPTSLAHQGDYLYVGNQTAGVAILDISNPENPTELDTIDLSATNPSAESDYVAIDGNKLYVIDEGSAPEYEHRGIYEISLSSPTQSQSIQFQSISISPHKILHDKNFIHLVGVAEGIGAFPLNPLGEMLGPYAPAYSINNFTRDIALKGNQLYIAHNQAGVLRLSLCP